MWQRHRRCCPMMSTKCTECSTVGEGAMICFSPSVCLPISRDSATLSSTPFFAQTKRNGGDQKKLQHFQLTKVSTGPSPLHISVTRPQGWVYLSPWSIGVPSWESLSTHIHISHKHVLWLQTSRKDLTWPKENSPTWRCTHRLLSEVIGAIHACSKVDQSVASSLHPRDRCKM